MPVFRRVQRVTRRLLRRRGSVQTLVLNLLLDLILVVRLPSSHAIRPSHCRMICLLAVRCGFFGGWLL